MKNKFINRFLMFIMLFVFLFAGKYCKGDEIAGYLANVSVGGYYFVCKVDGNVVGFDHFKIYSFSSKPVYFVNLKKNVPRTDYYYTNDYISLGFSNEQIDYINLIAYYGYEYPEHQSDYHYYMVTQELIFEYLTGNEFYWTDEFKTDGRELDFSKYKNDILELVDKHSVLPSFYFSNNEYVIGEKIELLDINSVLFNYEIVDDDGLNANIVDNKLVINNDDISVGEYTLHLNKKNYIDVSPYIYYNHESRMMFSLGRVENDEISIKINIKSANLKIKKHNSFDDGLSGAKLAVYDSDDVLIQTVVTDENGQAILEGVSFGTYKIKELDASYGYELDENVYYINVDKLSNEIILYGDQIVKKLEIFKAYGDDKLFHSGCIFDIMKDDVKYTSIVMNNDGYASVMLPYGKYFVRQKNCRNDYGEIVDFELEVDSYSDDVMTYFFHSDDDVFIKNPKTYDRFNKYIIFVCFGLFSLLVVFFILLRKVCYN